MRFILLMIALLSCASGYGEDVSTPKSNPVSDSQTLTYTLSGKVHNLRSGAVLVLQNNGGDGVIVQSGNQDFSFPTKMAVGRSYNLVVHTQLGQRCAFRNGTGAIASADVKDIVVECSKLDNAVLADERKEFTSVLQLNEGLVVSKDGRAKFAMEDDPTLGCAAKIEFKRDIRLLNEKIKFENLSDWPLSIKTNTDIAGKMAQKSIFLSLAELKKCKKSGDNWRSLNYFKEVNAVVDKSYADIFALTVNLYAQRIGYSTYVKQNQSIRKKFKVNIAQAIKQIKSQQAEAQRARELEQQHEAEKQKADALAKQQDEEKKQAEKAHLEELKKQEEERKRLAEEKRLGTLSQKEEEQMVLAEEQRKKDLELQKRQKIEYEKQFQPLHQRQQVDRLR
ncbi:MAG: hypothetical protein HOO95_04310 [Gallionella sp.]|nr:hypothetical protein [Gallionella sp.]